MDHFNFNHESLCCEQVPVEQIAQQFGTPLYVYSKATLTRHFNAFKDALASRKHHICYAVKANSNLSVLHTLASLGSGFDIVSGGELKRVELAGGDPSKTIFSGVGKQTHEIEQAIAANILCFNVESSHELEMIAQTASTMNRKAPIAIRVNPNIDPESHPYISTGLKDNKFGVDWKTALQLYQKAKVHPHLEVKGISSHIGSQITTTAPFVEMTKKLRGMINELKDQDITLSLVDLGGGLGVPYQHENPPSPKDYIEKAAPILDDLNATLIVEPGRAISANAGVLLTRALNIKPSGDKVFCIVDAAMNDLMRPSLYGAYQEIVNATITDQTPVLMDVVGPVCESGDFLGKERLLDARVGDLLAVRGSGAYGFTMSSNYNTRARAAEVMVDGEHVCLIRARENLESLVALEVPYLNQEPSSPPVEGLSE